MRHYEGLEAVDPTERERQRILTQALWQELVRQGAGPGAEGRIECFLYGTTQPTVLAMAERYRARDDWDVILDDSAEDERIRLCIITPLVRFSLDAFLELIDVMMIDALQFGVEFDGFQVNVADTQRPSWFARLLRSVFG
jgi:hypothetical protein